MSNPSFDGQTLWGGQTHVQSVSPTTRAQREQIPGVAGYRNYRLVDGIDTRTWIISGRITDTGVGALLSQIYAAQDYVNGNFYNFDDGGGVPFGDCELTDFRLVGEIETLINPATGALFATCRVQGTVVWAAPL